MYDTMGFICSAPLDYENQRSDFKLNSIVTVLATEQKSFR